MTSQPATANALRPETLAERLRTATHPIHEALDQSIMRARPFDSLENYGRFLKVQHAFHRDVSPLYTAAATRACIPDLERRGRLMSVTQDASDLDISLPEYGSAPPACTASDLPEALGWLYVVEGSNLGAAFLFKAAQKMGLSACHGARHLAEAPEGRAAGWRNFKDALNAAQLSPDEEHRVVAGSEAAFRRVRALVGQHLG